MEDDTRRGLRPRRLLSLQSLLRGQECVLPILLSASTLPTESKVEDWGLFMLEVEFVLLGVVGVVEGFE
jgi:hypothetical protein